MTRLIIIVVLVLYSMIPSAFADSDALSYVTLPPEDLQVLATQAGQAISTIPDGIDIYPATATDDGENHYVHVGQNAKDPSRFVFQYCRNGLSPSVAALGVFPKTRDCYSTIGNANGYTTGEIRAEIALMQKQASAQTRSSIVSSTTSAVVSGVVVLVALNVVELFTTDGTANIPTDVAAAAGRGFVSSLGRRFGLAAIKKAFAGGGKLVISSVLGTVSSQLVTSKAAQASTSKINDNPFSSPSEMKYETKVVSEIFSSGSVVTIHDDMETFELDLSQILAKIQ